MLSTGPSYNKLKTNLRLSVNRLKLLEKKKTELAQKSRKEIADYLANGKDERAKIRVEHIIREDYLVEAMEVIEMYCDLLLARFGLLQQMKTLDDGLAEAISSLLWAAPRLQSDVAELKVISDQLTAKYGKQYAQACRENGVGTVNEKLIHKLSLQAPPRILVERYLIEIAKSHNVPYEPDPDVLRQDEVMVSEGMLIDFNENKNRPGMSSYPPPPGFSIPPHPQHPQNSYQPFNYPQPGFVAGGSVGPPPSLPSIPPPLPSVPPNSGFSNSKPPFGGTSNPIDFLPPNIPAPSYESVTKPPPSPQLPPYKPSPRKNGSDTLPELPSVPSTSLNFDDDNPGGGGGGGSTEDVDFDDLSRRFEELKKRK